MNVHVYQLQAYADVGMEYDGSRVLNNISGLCPAEPTSLAVAAAHHTLTKLLLFLVQYVKVSCLDSASLHKLDSLCTYMPDTSFLLRTRTRSLS
jgi:formate hydrogenlyase subunit 3/multisubunit Na+/H+ antiporter MnhD subunit